jgi:DNA polymerase I-like protein with 3'-5' exonuclease and polymerase domains
VFKVSKEKMENSLKLKVPLVAEGSINTSWFSAK